jgi:hypothetical protein
MAWACCRGVGGACVSSVLIPGYLSEPFVTATENMKCYSGLKITASLGNVTVRGEKIWKADLQFVTTFSYLQPLCSLCFYLGSDGPDHGTCAAAHEMRSPTHSKPGNTTINTIHPSAEGPVARKYCQTGKLSHQLRLFFTRKWPVVGEWKIRLLSNINLLWILTMKHSFCSTGWINAESKIEWQVKNKEKFTNVTGQKSEF